MELGSAIRMNVFPSSSLTKLIKGPQRVRTGRSADSRWMSAHSQQRTNEDVSISVPRLFWGTENLLRKV